MGSDRNIEKKIHAVDLAIREGAHVLAKELLFSLFEEKAIPRLYAPECAALARRLGQNDHALSLLRPYVRPDDESAPIRPTDAERAEYAGALIRIGAVIEAQNLLDSVNPSKYPRALLFRAFSHVSKWEYAESERPLRALLSMAHADRYDRLIAKLNLAASLVIQRSDDSAFSFLNSLEAEARETQSTFVLSTVFELRAELHIQRAEWHEADATLTSGEGLLQNSDTIDRFLLKKQRTIFEIKQSGSALLARSCFKVLKAEAARRWHFESIRDCDYHQAVITKDVALARHLYHGTPFSSFRSRLEQYFPALKEEAGSYDLHYGNAPGHRSADRHFDTSQVQEMKIGQVPHRLLLAYCLDFYRPKRLAELYNVLFPGQHFFSRSSADRVHQANRRLNASLRATEIPLTAAARNGFYSLIAEPGYRVGLKCWNLGPPKKSPKSSFDDLCFKSLNRVPDKMWRRGVSAPEFAMYAGVSARTARRYLQSGVAHERIQKDGLGRATKYFMERKS